MKVLLFVEFFELIIENASFSCIAFDWKVVVIPLSDEILEFL